MRQARIDKMWHYLSHRRIEDRRSLSLSKSKPGFDKWFLSLPKGSTFDKIEPSYGSITSSRITYSLANSYVNHYNDGMRLILTHENGDFDAIASQLAAGKLYPDATILLPRRINRNVDQFLMLYWDALPFMRPTEWQRRRVDEIVLVDTQALNSVRGVVRHPKVHVIDHHLGHEKHERWTYQVEGLGATTTLLVEALQARGVLLTPEEATLLLLGIYEDTGSLTYDTTMARDIQAAAWLVQQKGIMAVVRRFLHIPLTPAQQALYDDLHTAVSWHEVRGKSIIVTSAAAPPNFTDEIASIAHRLRESLTPTGLFVLVQLDSDVQLVARSMTDDVDVAVIARQLGGGGHTRAAAARVKDVSVQAVTEKLVALLPEAIEPAVRVAELMSVGLQMVGPEMSIDEAAVLMRRYGYEGYPVFDEAQNQIVGLLTRRAIDRAVDHELGRLPVRRVMRAGSVTVRPSDSIDHLQQLMLTEGWGQIPVLARDGDDGENGRPIGIVTRTDLLNHLFRPKSDLAEADMRQLLLQSLEPAVWQMVLAISEVAAELELPLYFVGGLVRDMLLGKKPTDLDMVVEGDAILLAKSLQQKFGGDVRSHSRFGTAKWLLADEVWPAVLTRQVDENALKWRGDLVADVAEEPPQQTLASIDFVTARTEFYSEPTALPVVTHGSIKLDLHRRDFSINTLAVRLDGAFLGQLLDFYGGERDLEDGLIRVLHSLSFIDDPTRILRAIRLEQRLNFVLEPRTAELVADALPMLDRVSGARIRHEFELDFREDNPTPIMARMDDLRILEHVVAGLSWSVDTAVSFARVPVILQDEVWREARGNESLAFTYFALWMVSLDANIRDTAMVRLRVRKATLADVTACCEAVSALETLPADASPSVVVWALRPYPPRVLLVCRILLDGHTNITLLERYFREWRFVKTAVTGNDLREMGLKPSPLFGELLEKLLVARLDGEVVDEAGERELLEKFLA